MKPQVSSGEPIKIGATVALSGKLAYIGQQELNGLILAAEEINQDGGIDGRKIEVIAEDNKGDNKEAVAGVSKLLNVDNVDIIFSAFTPITESVKTLVFDAKKIFFYAATTPSFAQENGNTFRDYWDASQTGNIIAKTIIEKKIKSIAILSEKTDSCFGEFSATLKRDAVKEGVQVVQEEAFLSTETDFKTSLLKIKSAKPEAIVICGWKQEPTIMKQINELGMIDTPTFHLVAPFLPASDTAETRALYEQNKAISSWYGFIGEVSDKNYTKFASKYENRFGIKPSSDAAYSYDDVYVLSDAIKKCKSVDSVCVSEKIRTSKISGAGGALEFSDQGASKRELFLIQVKNGNWAIIK
jgi:branched-chain amino acid transport system substrate-binding protein